MIVTKYMLYQLILGGGQGKSNPVTKLEEVLTGDGKQYRIYVASSTVLSHSVFSKSHMLYYDRTHLHALKFVRFCCLFLYRNSLN